MIVSDLFIDIYKNFNVNDQSLKMIQLSRKELMLLLILSSDLFDELDEVVLKNFEPYESELKIIYSSLPDSYEDNPDISDVDLILLGEETNDKFIDTTVLTDINGNKLPNPLSKDEAFIKRREISINKIIN